jgi:hypothetical protein
MATGVFVGEYDDTTPLFRTGFIQIPGGIEGFSRWLFDNMLGYSEERGEYALWDRMVCEKFNPHPMARSWKLDELEPIRIEGFLYQWNPKWQKPGAMALKDGPNWTQAQRKRASDDLLRRNGWWLTAKDTGLKDANDANAAAKHALAYMRSIGHMPTIETHLR